MIFGSVRWRIASMTRDASLPVSHEAMTSLRFTGRKAPSSSCGGNVVRPAIHRTVVIRHESAEGNSCPRNILAPF